ncbi:MAG: HD domain-containing protein [Planctomycetota bacterium]
MRAISEIPELRSLTARTNLMRIPQEIDVPLTGRVRQIIDTAEFRRLCRISQLGLVAHVYPAAHHTRFEHSLGVYRMALLYLQRLMHDERFTSAVSAESAETLILAALLHDLGHWPFCHPIEDLRLPGVPEHELFANSFLLEGEIADTLRDEWGIQPRDVVALLSEKPRDQCSKILSSIVSGPIDIDKMDYLMRDSLHAGVPYGRNYDQARLIGSLCLNEKGDGIALTEKGKTAAEMMVFSRYVMFSEVYWHHAVRAATAMLQRAFYLLHGQLDLDFLFRLSETDFVAELIAQAENGPACDLLDGLFGDRRVLYKRWTQFNHFHRPEIYEKLARRPYDWLVACSEQIAEMLSHRLGRRVAPSEVLIDAPPIKLEVQFNIDIFYTKERTYRALGDVSPVVKTLAKQQFDDYVKSVRVLVSRKVAEDARKLEDASEIVLAAIAKTE